MNPDNPIPQTPQTPRNRRVLCIEDEHFIGELYARALTKAGYDINVIVDGVKGLEEAKTNQYDIILLDLMIPNMTGIDLLKKLRTDVPNLKAKIIITTNLEQKEETRKGIESQADGYIIKAEITPHQLVQILDGIA